MGWVAHVLALRLLDNFDVGGVAFCGIPNLLLSAQVFEMG